MQSGADRSSSHLSYHDDELIRQRAKTLEELKANNPEFGGNALKSQGNKTFKAHVEDVLRKRRQKYEEEQALTKHHIKELLQQRQKLEADQRKLNQAQGRVLSPYKVLDPIDVKNQALRQCNSYFMVHELVNDIVDRAVDKSHDSVYFHTKVSQETRLLLDSNERVLDHQQKFLTIGKITQLISEELLLEETNRLSKEVGTEWHYIEQYSRYQAQQISLQTVEYVTTGKSEGRNQDDPAYNLITATFNRLCKDRNLHRKEIWGHSQWLQSSKDELVTKSESVHSLLSMEPDVEKLDFLHLLPSDLIPRHKLPPAYREYRDQERDYWQNISPNKFSIELSKNIQGITVSAVSSNQRYVAFGTVRGDIIVYDLLPHPPSPIRSICNKINPDSIQHIQWSTDTSRLVTVTKTGNMTVWSLQLGQPLSQKDMKDLQLKPSSRLTPAPSYLTPLVIMHAAKHHFNFNKERQDMKDLQLKPSSRLTPAPSYLTPLVIMHAAKHHFNFNKGPLSETGAQTEIELPTFTAFHPAYSLLATQNHLMVGLHNGDMLRCDLYHNIRHKLKCKLRPDIPTVAHPTIQPSGGDSSLGKDMSAELFRHHKSAIRYIGFIGNHGDIVSVDEKGHIFTWKYSKKHLSHFGWFEPKDKYILEMAERVFEPRENEEPVFHIGNINEKGPYTKLQLNTLEYAEDFIKRCKLGVLWHESGSTKNNTLTKIYRQESVEETGSLFHTLVRERLQTPGLQGDILQHYSYYCKPAKNVSSRWLGVQQTPNGQELVFMLLFPRFWPKGPHITIIVVDLDPVRMSNTYINVKLSVADYKKCLEEDVCNFQVSQPFASTQSSYIFCCILGMLRVYSINTQTLMYQASMQGQIGKPGPKTGAGVRRNVINIAGIGGKIHVMSYSQVSSSIEFVKLEDENSREERQSVYEAFNAWKPDDFHQLPLEQTLRQTKWTFDSDPYRHTELYLYLTILDCMDEAISRSEGIPAMPVDVKEKYQREDRERMYHKLVARMDEKPELAEVTTGHS